MWGADMLCSFWTEARLTLLAVMSGITGGLGARHTACGEVLSCGDHKGPSMSVFTMSGALTGFPYLLSQPSLWCQWAKSASPQIPQPCKLKREVLQRTKAYGQGSTMHRCQTAARVPSQSKGSATRKLSVAVKPARKCISSKCWPTEHMNPISTPSPVSFLQNLNAHKWHLSSPALDMLTWTTRPHSV